MPWPREERRLYELPETGSMILRGGTDGERPASWYIAIEAADRDGDHPTNPEQAEEIDRILAQIPGATRVAGVAWEAVGAQAIEALEALLGQPRIITVEVYRNELVAALFASPPGDTAATFHFNWWDFDGATLQVTIDRSADGTASATTRDYQRPGYPPRSDVQPRFADMTFPAMAAEITTMVERDTFIWGHASWRPMQDSWEHHSPQT